MHKITGTPKTSEMPSGLQAPKGLNGRLAKMDCAPATYIPFPSLPYNKFALVRIGIKAWWLKPGLG
eukprot:scaffold306401_cov14-Prasinocladus_malaysianus.AAC.1